MWRPWHAWSRNARNSRSKARALFHELTAAHGLDFASRQLLKRLARATGVKQPARLFLEPQRFEPRNLPKDLQEKWPVIESLHSRLFGQGHENKAASAQSQV